MNKNEERGWWALVIALVTGLVLLTDQDVKSTLSLPGAKAYYDTTTKAVPGDFITIKWDWRVSRNGIYDDSTDTFVVLNVKGDSLVLEGPGPDSSKGKNPQLILRSGIHGVRENLSRIGQISRCGHGDVGYDALAAWYWLH